jgi:glycogen synthase
MEYLGFACVWADHIVTVSRESSVEILYPQWKTVLHSDATSYEGPCHTEGMGIREHLEDPLIMVDT